MALSDYVEGRVIPPYREHRYEGGFIAAAARRFYK